MNAAACSLNDVRYSAFAKMLRVVASNHALPAKEDRKMISAQAPYLSCEELINGTQIRQHCWSLERRVC